VILVAIRLVVLEHYRWPAGGEEGAVGLPLQEAHSVPFNVKQSDATLYSIKART